MLKLGCGVAVEVAGGRPSADVCRGWAAARCSQRPSVVPVLKLGRGWLVEGARSRPGAEVRRDWRAARCRRWPGAVDVLKLVRGCLVEEARVCPRAFVLVVGSRWLSGVRGGWSAEGLAACRVDGPVYPERSKPNDALQPTAFGRG